MDNQNQPTFGNGKICYLEIPSKDIQASANFYKNCFDWNVRVRGDGSFAFDDGVGQVSGSWVQNRTPDANPGIHIHIMVSNMDATVEKIRANGGTIIQEPDRTAKEVVARFADPAGNVLSLYEHRKG
jgi:predicted enzyme related to lactoylglutathione lyase